MSKWSQASMAIFALTISNFAFQAMTNVNWSVAFERSFFQAVAILLFVFIFLREEKS